MSQSFISIEGLSRRFAEPDGKDSLTVFRDLWLRIEKGEFVCMIGHSGCGKTTLLNCLAGLDSPSEGGIILDGREITGPSLDRAVIFQSHALMPWLSALDNIALAVSSRWPAWDKAKVRAQCLRYIALVHLEGAEDKKPAQLAGGMKQRVGIARARASEPQILLMDEPFSALDALIRGSLQSELLSICAATQQTSFMITHDVDEAIFLADKIVLMTNGPEAKIAEIVANSLPRDRSQAEMHRHPDYYPLRNHLVDFLVSRSRNFDAELVIGGWDPRRPPIATPGASSAQFAGPPEASPANRASA